MPDDGVHTYHNVSNKTILIPELPQFKLCWDKFCVLLGTGWVSTAVEILCRCCASGWQLISNVWTEWVKTNDLLWAPVLNHPCQCCLFRIVANIWTKPVDSLAEVVICTMNNLGSCHAWLERLKHLGKWWMQQLMLKFAERWIILWSVVTYRCCEAREKTNIMTTHF